MTMEEIILRKCSTKDLESIVQLEKIVFGAEGYSHLVMRQFYDITRDLINIAITSEGEITGYTFGCVKNQTSEAWILALAVNPQWRHRGIAKKLTTNLLNQLTEQGVNIVYLTVKPENKVAVNLYNSIGFEPIGYEDNYFGQGSSRTVMRKALASLTTA